MNFRLPPGFISGVERKFFGDVNKNTRLNFFVISSTGTQFSTMLKLTFVSLNKIGAENGGGCIVFVAR